MSLSESLSLSASLARARSPGHWATIRSANPVVQVVTVCVCFLLQYPLMLLFITDGRDLFISHLNTPRCVRRCVCVYYCSTYYKAVRGGVCVYYCSKLPITKLFACVFITEAFKEICKSWVNTPKAHELATSHGVVIVR